MLGGERQVLIDITLRIDDSGHVRLLVANQIRRVCEAIQVKLLQNHRSALRGRATILPLVSRDVRVYCLLGRIEPGDNWLLASFGHAGPPNRGYGATLSAALPLMRAEIAMSFR